MRLKAINIFFFSVTIESERALLNPWACKGSRFPYKFFLLFFQGCHGNEGEDLAMATAKFHQSNSSFLFPT